MFLSTRLSPGVLILSSLLGCFSSALLLVFLAGWWEEALFIGTAAVGYCVSLQFASGKSFPSNIGGDILVQGTLGLLSMLI